MSKPRLYIDSCCFIDVIKYDIANVLAPDRQNDIWYLQQCLRAGLAGDVDVITSTLTIAEVRRADGPPDDRVKRQIRSVLTSGKVLLLSQMTQGIAERARDLEWDDDINLKGADAIHIATALVTGCQEFFTNDGRGPLKNAGKIAPLGLKIVRPSDTLLLPSTLSV